MLPSQAPQMLIEGAALDQVRDDELCERLRLRIDALFYQGELIDHRRGGVQPAKPEAWRES